MELVSKLLRKPLVKGDVGVEIEVEGKDLVEVESDYWKSVDDGSLRGVFPKSRCEYVFNGPKPLREVPAALKELTDALAKSKPNFTFRTSVHVHVNIGGLTEDQLRNFIYTYLLLEEPLLNYCGKTRKANRFCLRLQDAEAIIDTLRMVMQKGVEALRLVPEDAIRYASINMAAIRKYCSLEFRGMRGTLDQGVLNNWIETLCRIRSWSTEQPDVMSIYNKFCDMGAVEFAREVFGDYAPIYEYPKMRQDMERSLSLSLDVPHAYFSRPKEKEKLTVSVKDYFVEAPHFIDAHIEPPPGFAEMVRQARVRLNNPIAVEGAPR